MIKLTNEEIAYLIRNRFSADQFKYYDAGIDFIYNLGMVAVSNAKDYDADDWLREIEDFTEVCKIRPEVKKLAKTVFLFKSSTYKKCTDISNMIDLGVPGIKLLIDARLKDLDKIYNK